MISRVTIANYKSIEAADFEARRVNVFIGEPNSGKSNLLEAIGLTSPQTIEHLRAVARLEDASELFFDHDVTRAVTVRLDSGLGLHLRGDGNQFRATLRRNEGPAAEAMDFLISPEVRTITGDTRSGATAIRLYCYRDFSRKEWSKTAIPTLNVPFGNNLPALLSVHKPLRDSVSALFRAKGFRLEIRASENRILMTKEVDDVLYSFPFESISETLRRIVFYKAVLETNKDAVLVLDEPEANTFPFYTKYLAERIALDNSNQFFLSTHNPYVLMSLIEKAPQAELAVYVTRMHNYRTELRALTPEECAEALDLGMSLFFNLDRYFSE